MACRCQRHECACRHCPECKLKACRCCCAQLDALASLSPADLAKAHDAHAAALAHLELALAALDTLPMDGFLGDLIKNPKETLSKASKAVANGAQKLASAVVSSKAAKAAYRKLPNGVKEVLENNRATKALKNAKEGGKTEYTRANEEHAETKEQFKKEAAAKAAAAAATAAPASNDTKFQLAARQTYLITKGPSDVMDLSDDDEDVHRKRSSIYDDMKTKSHDKDLKAADKGDLKAADKGYWKDLPYARHQQSQHGKDLNDEYRRPRNSARKQKRRGPDFWNIA